ncbi:MAG: hypothetical protein ABFS10_10150 [Bacteroidota bacterium]
MFIIRTIKDRRISLFFLVFVIITGITFISCENSEGEGGTASISGTLTEHFYNDDFSALIDTAPAIDEEVFITYGEDGTVGDRVLTSYSGQFRFDFLYPGKYTIYYRSDDSTSAVENDWSAYHEVKLERGEELNLGELVKVTALDYNDGAAVIKGVVKKINYLNSSVWPNLIVDYTDFAFEHEVYLTYGDHDFYDKRVRTQHNGYFEFSGLIPGEYLVFLYSEDVTRLKKHVVIKHEVTITEPGQVVDLGEITIEEF